MGQLLNFIQDRESSPKSNEYIENINPATGKVIGKVPNSGEEDINEAVEAAQNAFPYWSKISGEERAKYLLRIADFIEEYVEELASMETEDTGKPLSVSRTIDIPRSARNFRFFAHMAATFSSESHYSKEGVVNYTLRQPMGVVACISPWNLPLYLLSWKIAPALAAGNTVVAKPSEFTPQTAHFLGRLAKRAGLPAGVLNIVHGKGEPTGSALVNHPAIKAISFTGSTKVGATIQQLTVGTFKKLSLEMGGKNATLIFKDADLEKAASEAVRASFSNQGQICLCGSRILIEEAVYDDVMPEILKYVRKLQLGDPLSRDTQLGAIVSKPHYDKVMQYINLAEDEGGTILTGGKEAKLDGRCENGYFIQPTLVEDLSHNSRCNTEEIFGPMATLIPFKNEDDAILKANSTDYGLACSIWTNDLSRAHRLAEKMESGIVWINTWMNRDLRTPFGGVKNSGLGREGGLEAMRFFTEPKNVTIQY